jgi:hypothetical protein
VKSVLILRRYHKLECLEQKLVERPGLVSFAGAQWQITFEEGSKETVAKATVVAGRAEQVQMCLEFTPDSWNREVHVMLPAAAYNGNRFKCRPTEYPPKPVLLEDRQERPELVINDVPRLNIEGGEPSQLHITTGDETTPAITWFNAQEGKSTVILTAQGNEYGNYGLRIAESNDRRSALCSIESPVLRQTVYSHCRSDNPSWDRAVDLECGDSIEIPSLCISFDSSCVLDHYRGFALHRKDLSDPVELKHVLPFSASWDIQERKLNRDNWNGDYGYYAVGTRDHWEGEQHNVSQDWQPGWTGGGINSLALLALGDELSRERALKTLEFMFTKTQAQSGLLHGLYHQGQFYDDTFHHKTEQQWVMIRKNTDALYFALKHLLVLCDRGQQAPQAVVLGVRKLADALDGIWKRYGQFGQFFDVNSAELLVGGTLSGALGAGALALAGQFFEHPAYIETAKSAAAADFNTHVEKGLTTGGPGEILQAPDSEAAFAMLESLVVLYEVTGDRAWLPMAEAVADQCATWCASYDYKFPVESLFGKRNIRAAGSVWANVQNKHSSPGICTFSGDSLFKLYRATGEMRFLELITEIAHNLPQYMVRDGHALGDMKEGWICERVNFSDWEGPENIGGNMFGSCWPEVSLALTSLEIPGLYLQTDSALVQAIDHIDARVIDGSDVGEQDTGDNGAKGDTAGRDLKCRGAELTLELQNSTEFDAVVTVLAENQKEARQRVLGQVQVHHLPKVTVPARAKIRLSISLSDSTIRIQT